MAADHTARYHVVLDQVRDDWRSHDDITDAVHKRTRLSKAALWLRLRKLQAEGKIERRGERGSFEWRLVPKPA